MNISGSGIEFFFCNKFISKRQSKSKAVKSKLFLRAMSARTCKARSGNNSSERVVQGSQGSFEKAFSSNLSKHSITGYDPTLKIHLLTLMPTFISAI